ncbi:MAG: single-stranded DNA-binding protein [Bacteroidales bacterium]|nr:single-stranded DNA-binding protein [Bacteroidales bacterium]
MAGVNKVILIGNLGRDPEVRTLENGVKMARFSLATTETYKDKSGNRTDRTEWHNVVLWRGLAEVAESYLNKGSRIYLEGRIRYRQWEDKDGNKKYATDIEGENLMMLDGKDTKTVDPGGVESGDAIAGEPANPAENADDDLPF